MRCDIKNSSQGGVSCLWNTDTEGKEEPFPKMKLGNSDNSWYIHYVWGSFWNTLYTSTQFSQQSYARVTIIILFYVQGTQGTESFSTFSKVTQPIRGRMGDEPRQSGYIERGTWIPGGKTHRDLPQGELWLMLQNFHRLCRLYAVNFR